MRLTAPPRNALQCQDSGWGGRRPGEERGMTYRLCGESTALSEGRLAPGARQESNADCDSHQGSNMLRKLLLWVGSRSLTA